MRRQHFIYEEEGAIDVMMNDGYVQLARDLLNEDEWPVQLVCEVEGIEICLSDFVDSRLASMELRRGREYNWEPVRKWAIQTQYGLDLPQSSEEEEIRTLTSKSLRIQLKEGFQELLGDPVFVRQLKLFFVLPDQDEFYARQENKQLQEEVERLEQENADLIKQTKL